MGQAVIHRLILSLPARESKYIVCHTLGLAMRLLDLIRRQKVAVEVDGDVLVVTMPGTSFSITYEKTEENRLVANSFHARKRPNEMRKVTFPKFLSLAWTAANEKARELGWI